MRLPWLTLALISAALWISFGPAAEALSGSLRLERAAVLRGELWRLVTGHLVHGWPALAVVDLGALAVLGSWVESRSRVEWVLGLGLGALLAGTAVVALRSDLAVYQGASALAAAVFTSAAIQLLRVSSPAGRWLALLAIAGFGAKLALESAGLLRSPALVGAPHGVQSVPVAHLAGALGGALAAWAAPGSVRMMRGEE